MKCVYCGKREATEIDYWFRHCCKKCYNKNEFNEIVNQKEIKKGASLRMTSIDLVYIKRDGIVKWIPFNDFVKEIFKGRKTKKLKKRTNR